MILHYFIFCAANGISIFVLMFEDAPQTVSRTRNIVSMAVFFYFFIYLAGFLLSSRAREHFMLYTYINVGVLFFLMACSIGLRSKSGCEPMLQCRRPDK
jgi:hypothetical protein